VESVRVSTHPSMTCRLPKLASRRSHVKSSHDVGGYRRPPRPRPRPECPLHVDSGRPVCAITGHPPTAWRTGEFDPERESRARPVLYMKPRPVSDDPRFWAGLLSGNTVAIATTVWLSRFADSSFPKADADGRHIAEMVEPSYAGERLLCTKSYPGVLPLFLPRSTQNLCDRQT